MQCHANTTVDSQTYEIILRIICQVIEKFILYYVEQTQCTYRLLNVYCETFGTSSYGEGRTSLPVRLRHMKECQIFHNIPSITFLLYTFYIDLLVSSVLST